jgi:hypothetical protein
MLKKCSNCKEYLSLDNFHKNRSKGDGLKTHCKICNVIIGKNYRENNREKLKIQKHEYYLKNKDILVPKINKYINENRDRHNAWTTAAKNKLKREVFSHYCGNNDPKCKNCSITDLDILSIDHINGDGSKHREEIGLKGRGGYPIYRWIKKNNYPDMFQVLCFNCQYKKRSIEIKPEFPTAIQQKRIDIAKALKLQCIEKYGKICPCGENHIDTLTLHHINNDGAEHRKKMSNRGGFAFYLYLIKNNFPDNPPLQVLCINCNFKRRNQFYDRSEIYG